MFENCSFNGTFCNSSLVATNFGCSDNLTKKAFKWSFGDGAGRTSANIYKYVAANSINNKKGLDMIAQFCSGSSGVSINFNGKFYTPVADFDGIKGTNVMVIKNASKLNLSGGTLVQGLVFYNCSDVTINSMNFVGQHTIHDFPIVYATAKDDFSKAGAGLSTRNCYNIVANQFGACGLAPEGIYIKVDQGKESRNFLIENCGFEMRANGVITGVKGRTNNIHHVTVKDCKFSRCRVFLSYSRDISFIIPPVVGEDYVFFLLINEGDEVVVFREALEGFVVGGEDGLRTCPGQRFCITHVVCQTQIVVERSRQQLLVGILQRLINTTTQPLGTVALVVKFVVFMTSL